MLIEKWSELSKIPCSIEIAERAYADLVVCYFREEKLDADAHCDLTLRIFLAYPAAIVAWIVDPIAGLPSQGPYFPTPAAISTALRAASETIEAKMAVIWERNRR